MHLRTASFCAPRLDCSVDGGVYVVISHAVAADFRVETRAFKPLAGTLTHHSLGRACPRTVCYTVLGSGLNDPLAVRSDRVVHRVGSQVCAVGPYDRTEFDAHLSEVAWIAQRFEERPLYGGTLDHARR